MSDKIRIRMIQTVRPDLSFLLRPEERDMVLYEGKEYDAVTNPHGAISGICDNRKQLGVKPKEFEFIEAPEWVLRVHGKYEMIRMQTEVERLNKIIDKMDIRLVICGKELIEAENKRSVMQARLDRYMEESAKIPGMCKRKDLLCTECVQATECPHAGIGAGDECFSECEPDIYCPAICPKNHTIKYSTFQIYCSKCGCETEHECIRDDSGEMIETITTCLVCGNNDVDVDSKEQIEDEERYFQIVEGCDLPDMPESEAEDARDIESVEQTPDKSSE